MNEKVQQQTLCWSCRNAVPKMVNGKYVCGCSWSIHLEPVNGWTAEKSIKKPYSDDPTETWHVLDCPEYEEDRPDDAACNQDCDDGYEKLAAIVL